MTRPLFNFFDSYTNVETDNQPSDSSSSDSDSPTYEDTGSGNQNSNGLKCDFCDRILVETERLIKLDCSHALCRCCFKMFQNYPNRPKICPICCQKITNFT